MYRIDGFGSEKEGGRVDTVHDMASPGARGMEQNIVIPLARDENRTKCGNWRKV